MFKKVTSIYIQCFDINKLINYDSRKFYSYCILVIINAATHLDLVRGTLYLDMTKELSHLN